MEDILRFQSDRVDSWRRRRHGYRQRRTVDLARVVPVPRFSGPKKCPFFRHIKNAFSSGDLVPFFDHFWGHKKSVNRGFLGGIRIFRWLLKCAS